MIAICIESSHAKGMGHLFRGIQLAHCLSRHHRRFIFLINDHAPSLKQLAQRGLPYQIVSMNDDPDDWESRIIARYAIDLWINDRLDTEWEHAARVKNQNIALVTFDDTGSGAALSDLHIAPLAGCRDTRLEGGCILTDWRYLIVDPCLASFCRPRTKMNRLLVSLGGSDTHGAVLQVVRMLKQLNLKTTVHTGPAFEHHDELIQAVNGRFDWVSSVPSMGALYATHDLAITGGGITPFEAAASGLPCVVVANETFEVSTGRALASKGVAWFVGHYAALTEQKLISAIVKVQDHLRDMSEKCRRTIPTNGVEKVADAICRIV